MRDPGYSHGLWPTRRQVEQVSLSSAIRVLQERISASAWRFFACLSWPSSSRCEKRDWAQPNGAAGPGCAWLTKWA